MVKDKDMQFFMINMKMKRKRDKKNWPSPTGIWTPDFWTNSRPKFEFLWRLDPSSSGFLELLDLIWVAPKIRYGRMEHDEITNQDCQKAFFKYIIFFYTNTKDSCIYWE